MIFKVLTAAAVPDSYGKVHVQAMHVYPGNPRVAGLPLDLIIADPKLIDMMKLGHVFRIDPAPGADK